MTAVRLSDVVSVRGRFHRSVNVPKDWRQGVDLSGYVVTPTIRGITAQIVEELEAAKGTRSWSITGPYGSGKSAFALFLADLLATDYPNHAVARRVRESSKLPLDPFVPVLLVAERKPLGGALKRALADSLEPISPQLAQQVKSSDEDLAVLFVKAAESVRSSGFSGLLVVVDELGKFLEFAETNPTSDDVFVLQQIAESVERSEVPVLFVTILHSGFADYLRPGDELRRAEWQKVQGRFRDVPFQLPAEQMVALVAQALAKQAPKLLDQAWNREIEDTVAGASLTQALDHVPVELLQACAPLHPITTLLLWPIFRSKVAQNERSLFAFLTGGEGFGLQDFLRQKTWDGESAPLLRPAWLHDYVPWALGLAAFTGDRGRSWSLIDDALARIPRDAPAHCDDVLKTLGLLSMYGASVGLSASKAIIDAAVGHDSADALASLEAGSIVVYRKHAGGYALWEGSDVDLEAVFSQAQEHVGFGNVVDRLKRSLSLRPVMARRHYAETGTLRFLDVDLVAADTPSIQKALEAPTQGDGLLVYAIPEGNESVDGVTKRICELTAREGEALRIVAIPRVFAGIEAALREVECWSWVSDNVAELQGDRVARQEVRARRTAALDVLEGLAGRLFGVFGSPFQPSESVWIATGEVHDLRSARQFQRWISHRCKLAFPLAPRLHNELLNRRSLSSAAAAGRRNLLEAMVECAAKERLGIEGAPAEASMYEAMLQRGGFHQERDGAWSLGPPGEEWRPAWEAGLEFLHGTEGLRRPLEDLLDRLREPPFGVRDGPLPVLLCALLLANIDEVALYEEGVFVPEFRIEVVERLVRRPEIFELQSHRLDARQVAALQALRNVLHHRAEDSVVDEANLLPVVKSLVGFVSRLQPFARKTRRLQPVEAIGVRDRLLAARDPRALLFEELPEALEVDLTENGNALRFATLLQESLQGLRRAYPDLLDDIEIELRQTFGLHGSAGEAREKLASRAAPLMEFALDGSLGLFIREAAANHLEQDWRETLGRVLQGGLPPTHWSDRDLTAFRVRLQEVAGEFARLEELATAKNGSDVNRVLRIGILDGSYDERRAIITFDDATTPESLELADHVHDALRLNGGRDSLRLRLAAVAHVAAGLLDENDLRRRDDAV